MTISQNRENPTFIYPKYNIFYWDRKFGEATIYIYIYIFIFIFIFANQDAPYTLFEATPRAWKPPRRSFASRGDGLRFRVMLGVLLAVFHDVEPGPPV